jgi:hypothetical protein
MLRVGRAIFVFAGGLNHTYAAFDPIYGDQPIQNANTVEWQARKMRFDEAKGTDFVSRLRGHVNILGPNKTVQADQTFVVRRAIMLRHFLKQFGFVDEGTDRPKADLSVLRALLGTKYYKHGARSMRAILGMSMPIKGRLEKASLPTATQLDMHLHSADLLRRIRESNWSAEEEVTRTIPYPLSYPIQVASTVQAYELA